VFNISTKILYNMIDIFYFNSNNNAMPYFQYTFDISWIRHI